MAGALRCDAQVILTSKVDRLGDVVCALDDDDRRRALVDGEVPGLPGLVPGVVARYVDSTSDARAQLAHVRAGKARDLRHVVHCFLPVGVVPTMGRARSRVVGRRADSISASRTTVRRPSGRGRES